MTRLAFCFLTKDDVARPEMWRRWFQGAPKPEMYSVFVHRSDRGAGNVLAGIGAELIPAQQQPGEASAWGGFGIVRVHKALAERAYLAGGTKVVFLSGDCVPVQRFSAVYAALAASPNRGIMAWESPNPSHIRRNDDAQQQRRRTHWPVGWAWTWLVASQWSVLARHQVAALLENWQIVERTFQAPALAGVKNVPDEHAFVVLFAALGLLDSFDTRPFMHVEWADPVERKVDPDGICGMHGADDYDPTCSPFIFHAADDDGNGSDIGPGVRNAQAAGALFLRKVCPDAAVGTPWAEGYTGL